MGKLQVRVTAGDMERMETAARAEHSESVAAWARRVLLQYLEREHATSRRRR